MGSLCNLYPPILNSSSPAFLRTDDCKVHFSLSYKNKISDVANIQVAVNSQKTNKTGLSTSKYPNGIKIIDWKEVEYDNEWRGDDKYFIRISPIDMQDGEFPLNNFFKVQLRLTSIDASLSSINTAAWLVNNAPYFSEWSRVCLIKGIDEPIIDFTGLQRNESGEISYLKSPTLELHGEFKYGDENISNVDSEYLTQYRVKIYATDESDNLLADSGIKYTETYNNLNQINYISNYLFNSGINYTIEFWFLTNNMYENIYYYNFIVADSSIVSMGDDDKVSATSNSNLGCIEVCYSIKEFVGNLIIRRSSSDSNFKEWSDIYTAAYTPAETINNRVWRDYSIESGVFYVYGIQKRNSVGLRGPMIISEEASILEFDAPYLTGNSKNLKLAHDFKISNFSYKVVESSTETLGSKYPFIRRNGDVKYRTFSMSGLISSFMDEDSNYSFASKEEIYKDSKSLYDEYNNIKQIDKYYDYIYEREFREKVMDFLYSDSVKLFRSPTEGNILIKLMNISFTPNDVLGRMIYSFSATAYEIDEATPEKIQYYNIQPMDDFVTYVASKDEKISYDNLYVKSNSNVLSYIMEQYDIGDDKSSILDKDIFYMKNALINIESAPYQIIDNDGILLPYDSNQTRTLEQSLLFGYIISVNNEEIFIKDDGVYQIEDSEIYSISFPVNTSLSISGTSVITMKENTGLDIKSLSYKKITGQIVDYLNINTKDTRDIIQEIINKHYSKTSLFRTYLDSLDYIEIETEPNTIFKINNNESYLLKANKDGFLSIDCDGIESIKLYSIEPTKYYTQSSGIVVKNPSGVDTMITYVGEIIKEVF